MAKKVIEATPKVIDTIRKANQLVNSSTIIDQAPSNRVNTTRMESKSTTAGTLVPAKITGGNGLTGYLCNIFENGLSEPPTSKGTVFLANGASTIFVLPPGSIIFVQRYPVTVHGGVGL